MKKGFVIAVSIGFVVFFLAGRELQWFVSSNSESFPKLPDSPQFVPSTDFDGEWLGRRINTTGNNMCEPQPSPVSFVRVKPRYGLPTTEHH